MDNVEIVEAKHQALSRRLDEATLRLWAATEGGVCGVIVIASREEFGSYGWRGHCRGLFHIPVPA